MYTQTGSLEHPPKCFLPPAIIFPPCSMKRKTYTGKEDKHFVGEHHSCPLVDHQPFSVSATQAQKKTGVPAACCSSAPSIQAHKVIERRTCKKGLNSLSDTHYFIPVFPFHFWEIYAVVVWLRLQFLSFFILVFIKKKKKKEKYLSKQLGNFLN